jgi:hypothetical protein
MQATAVAVHAVCTEQLDQSNLIIFYAYYIIIHGLNSNTAVKQPFHGYNAQRGYKAGIN